MLITYLTATACAVAAICLGRSEYEKKALSVEEMNLYSDKVSKDCTFLFFCPISKKTPLDRTMKKTDPLLIKYGRMLS